jgi:hypothetical protein
VSTRYAAGPEAPARLIASPSGCSMVLTYASRWIASSDDVWMRRMFDGGGPRVRVMVRDAPRVLAVAVTTTATFSADCHGQPPSPRAR